MKFIKSKLFIFILGGIFFSSITALAVTTISADKITYTDKNNIERTVDVVLDDLYSGIDNMGKTYDSNITKVNGQPSSISVTVELEPGKYVCNNDYVQPFTTSITRDRIEEYSPTITGCNNYYITEKTLYNKSGIVPANNVYSAVIYGYMNFTCDISETSNITVTRTAANQYDENLAIFNLICNKIK